ncbi:acyltransferase family protein [Ligilactobacillus agilis]|uniref:acyltransferase family protein n=1 Tax=Ligilactobacillus agilis TaxID=1601 RepID=UPI000B5DAA59|nr:acyltransferase family protein [Ligilactobacillus agilis]
MIQVTGYFLINRKDNFENSFKRVAKLWLEVWFYSVITFIIGIIYLRDISLKELVISIFPIIFNKYWFVTAYVMLMLLVPFINKVVDSLNKKEYLILLICVTIFAGVFPIIGNRIFGQETGFSILLAVYLFGGYIRKHGLKIKVSSIYIYVSIIVIYMGMLSSLVILGKLTSFSGHFDRFMYGIFPLIESVLIFLLVIELKPFTNKGINTIASSVFSTYLVTQNHSMVTIIWERIFNVSKLENIFLIILTGFGIAVFLLLLTVLIDKVRIFLFRKLKFEESVLKLVDKIIKNN